MTADKRTLVSYLPQGIREDSWLNEERFAAFRAGYAYATTQTFAIEALSDCSAEAIYYAWNAINRGIKRAADGDVW